MSDTLFSERNSDPLLFDDLPAEDPPASAIPLDRDDDQPIADGRDRDEASLESSRALAISDFVPPSSGPGERLIRLAYRLGISGSTITAPFRKPAKPRLLATVESPLAGDRMAGVAMRAGHFLVHGAKVPIAQMEFESSSRMAPPFERVVHGFAWLRDLSTSAVREQCTEVAEQVARAWLKANPEPGKGAAWEVEHAGHRLMAWLVHAPLILSGRDDAWRRQMLTGMESTARWLDRNTGKARDGLAKLAGWCAITAAGLLMPEGKPRRLFGEAGLIAALGDVVGEDGGVLSRSPLAQMDAVALLVDLRACYEAAGREMPQSLGVMLELLVPPLLTLRHGDGGLGSWQGGGAISAHQVAALIDASGVRTRPLKEVQHWGYQRMAGGKVLVQFDAAPPPKPKNARWGCASTLAFEMSDGAHRLIVNCGGAALAGGQVPQRIEQGLRATAAHSTMVLDNANSTAVLLHGQLGKGAEKVELDRRDMGGGAAAATRVEASHDGYAARFGLIHRRILMLRADGMELRGEDILVPASRKGTRGKIAYAIRFHLGAGVEARLAEDHCGAGLLLPDGNYWHFRIAGDDRGARVGLEDSLWVDGDGKPHATQQLVIEGLTSRSGGQFSWLLKKMG